MSTDLKRDWKPVRNGSIYCSPACGAGCKHSDYVKANEQAKILAELCRKAVGGKWTPFVHENLGWHYYVVQQGTLISVREITDSNGSKYRIGIDGGTPTIVSVNDSFESIEEAYRVQVNLIAKEANKWINLLREIQKYS